MLLGPVLIQQQACWIKHPVLIKQRDKDKEERTKPPFLVFIDCTVVGLSTVNDAMPFGDLVWVYCV